MRLDIFESHGLVLEQPKSQADVTAKNLLRSGAVIGARPTDVIITRREIEHGPVAEDEAEGEQPLGRRTIVVVAQAVGPRNGAGGAEADAGQGRSLHGHVAREPPLFGRPERDGGRGDAKNRRSNVIVTAVEPPDAPVVVPDLVVRPVKEAAHHDILDKVAPVRTGLGGEFEREVIKGSVVGITRLARESVGEGKVQDCLFLFPVGVGGPFVEQEVVRLDEIRADAPAQAHEGRRVMAREHGLEAVAKHEAVEAGRWSDHRGP